VPRRDDRANAGGRALPLPGGGGILDLLHAPWRGTDTASRTRAQWTPKLAVAVGIGRGREQLFDASPAGGVTVLAMNDRRSRIAKRLSPLMTAAILKRCRSDCARNSSGEHGHRRGRSPSSAVSPRCGIVGREITVKTAGTAEAMRRRFSPADIRREGRVRVGEGEEFLTMLAVTSSRGVRRRSPARIRVG